MFTFHKVNIWLFYYYHYPGEENIRRHKSNANIYFRSKYKLFSKWKWWETETERGGRMRLKSICSPHVNSCCEIAAFGLEHLSHYMQLERFQCFMQMQSARKQEKCKKHRCTSSKRSHSIWMRSHSHTQRERAKQTHRIQHKSASNSSGSQSK